VGAGIMASILGTGLPLASAAGGWDVPSDSLAMVHKKEMILPPWLAERVRGMTGGGGHTINITYAPSTRYRMTQADYNQDSKMLVKAVDRELRNRGKSI